MSSRNLLVRKDGNAVTALRKLPHRQVANSSWQSVRMSALSVMDLIFVSIERDGVAKEQGLTINSFQKRGVCGRV